MKENKNYFTFVKLNKKWIEQDFFGYLTKMGLKLGERYAHQIIKKDTKPSNKTDPLHFWLSENSNFGHHLSRMTISNQTDTKVLLQNCQIFDSNPT